jgi:hypothetical protein
MEQLDKTWNKCTNHGTTGQNMEQLDKTMKKLEKT